MLASWGRDTYPYSDSGEHHLLRDALLFEIPQWMRSQAIAGAVQVGR